MGKRLLKKGGKSVKIFGEGTKGRELGSGFLRAEKVILNYLLPLRKLLEGLKQKEEE